MKLRRAALTLHRWLGVAVAPFLFTAGITGAIFALQPDLERWLHPELYRASPSGAALSEDALAERVRASADGDAISVIHYPGPALARVFELQSGRRVFVDPRSGAILGSLADDAPLARFLLAVRRVHTHLLAGIPGQWIVDLATLAALLLLPLGLALWWKRKTMTIDRHRGWRRINLDVHSATGFYSLVLAALVTLTGVFIAFEGALHFVTRSQPVRAEALPHSTIPTGAPHADAPLDSIVAAADRALPLQATIGIEMPGTARSAIRVVKRGAAGVGRSTVFLDRYTGALLRVDDFASAGRAERAHAYNRALHTGELLGLPSRIVMSLTSLAIALLAVTGVAQWWRRIGATARPAPAHGASAL